MKTLSVLCLLSCLWFAGCATTNSTNTDPAAVEAARIARMTTVAELAAFTGTSLRLQSHPQDRPLFEASLAALDVLVSDQNYDPAALQGALQKLPIKELQGEQGALILGAALILYDSYARDVVKLDRSIYVLPVINAVRSGISRGLRGYNGP